MPLRWPVTVTFSTSCVPVDWADAATVSVSKAAADNADVPMSLENEFILPPCYETYLAEEKSSAPPTFKNLNGVMVSRLRCDDLMNVSGSDRKCCAADAIDCVLRAHAASVGRRKYLCVANRRIGTKLGVTFFLNNRHSWRL